MESLRLVMNKYGFQCRDMMDEILETLLASCPDVDSKPVAYYQPYFRKQYGNAMNNVIMADELNSFDFSIPQNIETRDIWAKGNPLYTHPAPDRVAELEARVEELNRYLREKGMGQGEIDSISSLYDDIATLEADKARLIEACEKILNPTRWNKYGKSDMQVLADLLAEMKGGE